MTRSPAQLCTTAWGALRGIPRHGVVTQCSAGDNCTASSFSGHHTQNTTQISVLARVFHLKAFRASEAKGHPVLRASSCSSGSHIGQSRACSRLSTSNTGGHGSLGSGCFLTVWRWQLLSALPALLLEIAFFCFLRLRSCLRSMVLKNFTWEKTF